MAKQNKYKFWKRVRMTDSLQDPTELVRKVKNNYINKYYNLWMSKYEWKGLDEEVAAEQENFIMRKLWADGKIACRQVKGIDMLAFAPFSEVELDLYDFPATIQLINKRNASKVIIPEEELVVNKDAVIGWAQPNRKPIYAVVEYYVDRIAEVEMVINTNLNLMKMPFLIGVNEENRARMEDVVRRILNNELVVFADLEDVAKIQSVATQTPYIIDQLKDHQRTLESELLSFLGIDNVDVEKKERLITDEANANNDMINSYGESITSEIEKFLADIKRVFGREITITPRNKPVSSNSESIRDKDNTNEKEDKEADENDR